MKRDLSELGIAQLVRGSAVLAAEGRQWREQAHRLGRMALAAGKVRLVTPDHLPSNGTRLASSLQGTAADDRDWEWLPADLRTAYQLLKPTLHEPAAGIVSQFSPRGGPLGAALLAAVTGLPLLDAVLEQDVAAEAWPVAHAVVGGNRNRQRYIEWLSRESNPVTSSLLQSTMATVGGFYSHLQQLTPAASLDGGWLSRTLWLGAELARVEKRGVQAVADWLQTNLDLRLVGQGYWTPTLPRDPSPRNERLVTLQGKRQRGAQTRLLWLDAADRVRDELSGELLTPLWLSSSAEVLTAAELNAGDWVTLLLPSTVPAATAVGSTRSARPLRSPAVALPLAKAG